MWGRVVLLTRSGRAGFTRQSGRRSRCFLMSTADWGYLRLRRLDYNARELRAWCERIAAQPWSEAFVFFKHEDEAKGPEFAQRFLTLSRRVREIRCG